MPRPTRKFDARTIFVDEPLGPVFAAGLEVEAAGVAEEFGLVLAAAPEGGCRGFAVDAGTAGFGGRGRGRSHARSHSRRGRRQHTHARRRGR